jgi:threonine/homoserine/homoserine lactone efflux protein
VIQLLLGLVFLYLAVRQWQSRPKEGEEPEMPGWMAAIDSFTPVRAFGLGALLAGVNPKNLVLIIAAGTTIAQAGLSSGDMWLVLGVFAVLASLGVAGPVAYYLLAERSAKRVLNDMKVWLISNSATVMVVVLVILGVVLVGQALGGLTA